MNNRCQQVIGTPVKALYPTAIVQDERGHRNPWPNFRKLIAAELCVLEGELFNKNGWQIEKFKK